MKLQILRSLVLFALPPALFASPPEALQPARTFVPDALQVASFTPPAPVVREPLPDIRIDASTILRSKSGTTLTIQRGESSTLPDIPPPPSPEPAQPAQEPTPEQLARQLYQWRHSIRLGANVYDHKISDVRWTDRETGAGYRAVCGFDIGLLAGIGRFVRDGETYSVDLIHGDFDTSEIRRSAHEIPAVSPGQILITQGDPNAPYATAPLHFINDLIASEKERLTVFQAARKQYQREAAAWADAHPAVPSDETFIFRPTAAAVTWQIPSRRRREKQHDDNILLAQLASLPLNSGLWFLVSIDQRPAYDH